MLQGRRRRSDHSSDLLLHAVTRHSAGISWPRDRYTLSRLGAFTFAGDLFGARRVWMVAHAPVSRRIEVDGGMAMTKKVILYSATG